MMASAVGLFRQKKNVGTEPKSAFLMRQRGFWFRLVALFGWG